MSNKKLRNVRFEVPQMSEEMGFRWCLRRWRMRNRLPKNLARMQFGRLGDCSACRLAISGRTSPANGSRFPRISGVLSTQTVSLHKCALPRSANDFAKQSLVSTPCGCLGYRGLPDVSTDQAVPNARSAMLAAPHANQWPPPRGLFHAWSKRFPRAWKTNGCSEAFKTKKPLL